MKQGTHGHTQKHNGTYKENVQRTCMLIQYDGGRTDSTRTFLWVPSSVNATE